jgi:23S rRNA G2069 N7-methylase RlmK/C1962 C5-methylase RlmI
VVASVEEKQKKEQRTKNKEKPTEQWLSGWLQKKTPIIEEFFEKFVMAAQRTKPHPLG